ncbi:MAG: hypothetical protein MJE12_09700 [Alphaproteobacteria bacterium]|nr:hypothetical protein [Alphaproteobacteria bacterium]
MPDEEQSDMEIMATALPRVANTEETKRTFNNHKGCASAGANTSRSFFSGFALLLAVGCILPMIRGSAYPKQVFDLAAGTTAGFVSMLAA